MSQDATVWEIQLGIHATEQQAEQLKKDIVRLLCPDPDHAPPCPIPWSIRLTIDDEDSYPAVVEQARVEYPPTEG